MSDDKSSIYSFRGEVAYSISSLWEEISFSILSWRSYSFCFNSLTSESESDYLTLVLSYSSNYLILSDTLLTGSIYNYSSSSSILDLGGLVSSYSLGELSSNALSYSSNSLILSCIDSIFSCCSSIIS